MSQSRIGGSRSDTSAERTPKGMSGQRLGLGLVVIASAQLMLTLDATIVNVALPTIHRSLHFSTADLEWLVTTYALTFGGLLIFGGRTGDLFGKRRMFMAGIAVFAVASLAGGLAQDEIWLIITRGAQGVGAAIASPTALSLIAVTFPEGEARNRATGVYATMSVAGAAVGLLLGGIFTDLVSWRLIFFVNVPAGALVLFLAPRALKESEATGGRLDVPGAVSVTAGMLLLVYGLSTASNHPWGSLGTVIPLVAAAVSLVVFGVIESRSAAPLVPLGIFATRNRSGAYAIMFCVSTASFAFYYFLTQFVQNILGYSPLKAGVAFLPIAVGIGAAAVIVSKLVGRIGIWIPLLLGPAGVAIGLAWLSRLTPASTYLDILGPMLVASVGMGITFVPVTITAVSGVRREEAGLTSALLNTSQQVGGALGLAVLATVAIDATKTKATALAAANHGHLTRSSTQLATTHGYTTAFLVGSGVVLVGLLVSATVVRVNRRAVPDTDTTNHAPHVDGPIR